MGKLDLKMLEEIRELGQEYRYRDQLIVHEFYLSMLTVTVALNLLSGIEPGFESLIIKIFLAGFLGLLSFHLGHINYDRKETGARKYQLAKKIGMQINHKGFRPSKGRLFSVPTMMVQFSIVVFIGFSIWTLHSAFVLFEKQLSAAS